MFDALYIGATGMRAQQSQIDAVANNVANLNTVGFRRSVVSFEEATAAMTPTSVDPMLAAVRASLTERGAGALAHTTSSTVGGALNQTGEPLNIAIDGSGYLEVIRADGTPAYTRNGALEVNADGELAAADGTPLAGSMRLPPDMQSLQISADGQVLATVAGQSQPVQVGKLELVSFANPAALQAVGNNQFVATADSGEARTGTPGEQGLGSIKQGFLEASNVQLVEELTSMMLAQRGFELNGRVVQAADQMMAITNSLYRT
ncbi:MAG TPA: flagellar hook-basal body complex protein [Steroidobacteraceae bacterium]|nr:flagellar hook-basal body complex protein [Steroidobacteraceae bacterium]